MGWKTAFVINTMEWLSHQQRIGGVALPAKSKTAKRSKKGRSKSKRGVNQALVKSLAHELRAEILAILNERMASPNELAKELGEGLSQVSYHVKVLKDYEVIRLVKTEPRRGAVEHYYRATSRAYLTDRDWHELPKSAREAMSADLFQMILDDVVASLEDEVFDEREDRHMSWTPMLVDEQGWLEINGLLDATLKEVLKAQAASVKRLTKSKESGINMSVSMLGYEVPEKAAKKMPKRKSKSSAKKAKAKKK
ncbi:MAG TPA: winged helix-turn-helix domain-containing protein [Solirubrobacterales bacterium]|nr:winged helix-turn-helix domain-containing protein [Solirubrobacterales bacterium]